MNDLSFKNDSSKKPFFKRKKSCPFSGPNAPAIDYKDVKLLSRYVTERGKIIPSRISSISTIITSEFCFLEGNTFWYKSKLKNETDLTIFGLLIFKDIKSNNIEIYIR